MKLFLVVCLMILSCSGQSSAASKSRHFFGHSKDGKNAAGGDIWAVVVAGSNTYMNYRHQANVCHAYHMLHDHGIPDDHIVMMFYDDVANDPENPYPGNLINQPNGPNVYESCVKDYTGDDVTVANFFNVINGQPTSGGSGKVVNSGPNDNLFIYFTDHGGDQLVAFPNEYLYADDLNKQLLNLYNNNRFNELVVYWEACESGSMFDGLIGSNQKTFVITSAKPPESTYACYYDEARGTYLGDEFSTKWLEDSDAEDLNTEIFTTQYNFLVANVPSSTPQEYADLTMASLTVGQFQGHDKQVTKKALKKDYPLDSVDAREIPVEILKRKIETANSDEEVSDLTEKLDKVVRDRQFLDTTVESIVRKVVDNQNDVDIIINGKNSSPDNFSCYKQIVDYFSENCFSLPQNTYALGKVRVFNNLCSAGISADSVVEAIDQVCTHPTVIGIH